MVQNLFYFSLVTTLTTFITANPDTIVVKRGRVKLVPGDVKEYPITGELHFYDDGVRVRVSGRIEGLEPGEHGMHVHESGILTNKCKDAGGHYNPFKKPHGSPQDIYRHVGDLGNIVADEYGVAKVEITDRLISLNPMNPAYIGGLAVVIHAEKDDLGKGGTETSVSSGSAGSRRACGTIDVEHGLFLQPVLPPLQGVNSPFGYGRPLSPQIPYHTPQYISPYQYPHLPVPPVSGFSNPYFRPGPYNPYGPYYKR